MAEKSAREPRVYLWDTSRQVGTNLNAILRGRIFVQMLPRPPVQWSGCLPGTPPSMNLFASTGWLVLILILLIIIVLLLL